MQLEPVLSPLVESCGELVDALGKSEPLPALSLRRAARLPVLAALRRLVPGPFLLVTDRADHALTLFDELSLWAPEASRLLFPEPTTLFYEKAAWGPSTRRERLLALTALAGYHLPSAMEAGEPAHPILVAPARALMVRTLPRREFLKATRTLKAGQSVPPDVLARTWAGMGYEHANTVIAPGEFTRRGGILDIWPPAATQPTRIEFFGDEIESLRDFDPATQRTIKPHDRLLVTPAREFLPPAEVDPSLEEPSEFYIPPLHTSPASLLDYLPRQALVLFDDLQAVQDAVLDVEEQAVALRREALAEGVIADEFPIPYMSWSELADSLPRNRTVELGGASGDEAGSKALSLPDRFVAGPRYAGRLKPFMEHVAERVSDGEQVVIVSRQSARLNELWSEQNHEPYPRPPLFVDSSLTEGFTFIPVSAPPVH